MWYEENKIFKKNEVQPSELFSFMNPLAVEILLYILDSGKVLP
jgi:hypothetical protein